MENSHLPQPGDTLGSYIFEAEIARGSMGIIFRGSHQKLKKQLAIKMLPHSFTQDKNYIQRFYLEAEAASKIKHPNIATVYDILEGFDTYFYIMDFIDGITLEDKIKDEGLHTKQAIHIMKQCLSGLQYAHQQGVVHRDLKPANIMIDRQNQAIITDFGLAKIENSTVITLDGTIMGTPAYMSPEQIRAESIDSRSDVYSLGVIFYEMLTERSPFHTHHHMATMKKVLDESPTNPKKINQNIPKDIDIIVMKSIEKEPILRYQTAQEYLEDIIRFEQGDPIQAQAPTIYDKISKKIIKYRLFSSILLTVVLSAALLLIGIQWNHYRKNQISQKTIQDAEQKISQSEQEKEILLNRLSEDPLFRVLNDPDPFVRANALTAIHKKVRGKELIGKLEDKAMQITMNSLHDPHPQVRKNAAILMGLLKDPIWIEPLTNQLKVEENEEVISHILIALGWMQAESSLEIMHSFLDHESDSIKEQALLAVGMMKNPSSIDFMIPLLKNSNPNIRSNTVLALTEIADPIVIPYLLPLTNDVSEKVRNTVDKAIQFFGPASRTPMIQFILSNDHADENLVLEVLNSIVPEKDEGLLPLLIYRLNDPRETIRYQTTMIVGLFAKKNTIIHLIEQLKDPSNQVKEAAHLSLIGITQENFGKDYQKWKAWYTSSHTD